MINILDYELEDNNSIKSIEFEKTIFNEIILENSFMLQNKCLFTLKKLIISKKKALLNCI